MTQQEWDAMSVEEKQKYLQGYEAVVSSQAALNGEARVGDDDAFVTIYTVYRGEVMTAQSRTLLESAQTDAECCGLTEEVATDE